MVRVNDTRTAISEPPSHTTRLLLELLQQWPRRLISAILLETPEPEDVLTSGALRHQLARSQQLNRLRKPPQVPNAQWLRTKQRSAAAVVGYFDEQFPAVLRTIPDPPLALYYLGSLGALADTAVAIVGARKCTHMGRHNAFRLAQGLSEAGVTVVSGLALGIDGVAHQGALRAAAGAGTVAVLGSGLAQIYPKRHAGLARQILSAGGLLLSEYPDFYQPRPYHFPERNRLISGLSNATVVVEANLNSGSLITARFAAEQGRDVFAMPGPVQNETSYGCHQLIKDGAGLLTQVSDLLYELGKEPVQMSGRDLPAKTTALSETAQQLYANIQGYPATIDELLLSTNLDQQLLSQALVELELAGFVEQGPLGYIRTPR
jgi:DNA processing protein